MKTVHFIIVFTLLLLPVAFSFSQKQPVLLTSHSDYSVIPEIDHLPFAEHTVSFLNAEIDTITITGFGYIYPSINYIDSTCFVKTSWKTFKSNIPKDEVVLTVFFQDTVETQLFIYGSDSMVFYKALPILIQNVGDEKHVIGAGSSLDVFLEAKAENGHWYRVEELKEHEYDNHILLPPGYFAITCGILYKGDFETVLRYRLGENTSNIFPGTIMKKWIP